MNFEQFQNQSRLYVIGALEQEELEEFEKAKVNFALEARGRQVTREKSGASPGRHDESRRYKRCHRGSFDRSVCTEPLPFAADAVIHLWSMGFE